VSATIGDARLAPVIPQLAIRPSERGFLAFVVENGVAKERILKLGMHTLEGTVEVIDGLKAGELLVVRGAEPLVDGAAVRLTDADGGAPMHGEGGMHGDGGAMAMHGDGGAHEGAHRDGDGGKDAR
jgi:hypothetical protein